MGYTANIPKFCAACGLSTHSGKGCPKRKRKSGKKPAREILSFDCETNSNGIVLFLCSGEDRSRADYLYSATGLELAEILDWMIRAGTGSLCFGFYFDYDVNQLVAKLPHLHQGQLAAKGSVTWHDYRIRHTPGKRFQVAKDGKSVCIWDCASWAQTSFLRVCQDWNLGTEAERAEVAVMKAKRGDFDSATRDELVSYTTLECALLSEWVAVLLKLHVDCGIQLRAYSGPGSSASALIRAKEWKPPAVPDHIGRQPGTKSVSDPGGIAFQAFFGGRSEISCIGPVPGPIYGYDLNSAYPSAIADLPELTDAKWRRVKRFEPSAWGFYKVEWKQRKTACWGMFPVRGAMLPDGRRSVSLLYPTEGSGWFHSIEVAAAIALEPASVAVIDGYVIEDRGRPFAWVEQEAERRLAFKAAGDSRHKVLKLAINSIYGKLAQHTGTHPLQCITYAAAITAWTRAQLLSAAYPHGHSVFLLATDGILSTVPLPALPLGASLRTWEADEYESAWMLQAGVYWAGKKKKTRGIDARTLELEDVESLWFRRETSAVLTLPSRRVMSYRLCSAQGHLERTGTWYDSERSVKFSPRPRRKSYRWIGNRLLTVPAPTADYRQTALVDSMMIELDPGAKFDEFEGLPDWAIPD